MPSIIIVEDDPMISEIYERKFKEDGFDVATASSGEQVLEMAKKRKVDLILSDLIMPKMDGFEIIRNLRGGSYDPDIKIIISSNLSQKEDRDKALGLGADGFVTKSDYTPGEMVQEIKRLLHEFAEQKRNEMIRNGELDVRNGKKVLMMEDEEVFADLFGNKLRQDGFEVEVAKTGHEAMEKALKGGFDVFIVDMVMPGMTGDEIIKRLKEEESTKNVPIIAYSASEAYDVIDNVKAMGLEVFTKTQLIPSQLSKKVADACGVER